MVSGNKNILVLTYWGFNSAILNSYALPYIRIIRKTIPPENKIYLFTLTPKSANTKADYFAIKENLSKEGICLINYDYTPFGFLMALKFIYILFFLIFFTIKHKIRFIHAWCTPGGAIGYIVSKFTGRDLILDSFEPHAESMVETKTWKKESVAFNILFKLEQWQLKKAKHVICAAKGMIKYSQDTYHVVKQNYFVKPACVDLHLFKKTQKDFSLISEITNDSIVCVYVGKFGDIYLSQEVFDFFKIASNYWGAKFKVILLTNDSNENIDSFCLKAQLDRKTVINRFVNHSAVPKYMSLGSFGICPVKPVNSKKYCTPIKNGEYWAMGLPVVITKNISTDSDLISAHKIGYVLEELNSKEYLNAVKTIDELLLDKTLSDTIRGIAESHRNYSIAEKIYKTIYA